MSSNRVTWLPWGMALAAMALATGCGDDISCPDGMVVIGGECVPDDGMDMGACEPNDALETCDGSDEDCDGNIDEGLALSTLFVDEDGDGYGGESIGACGPIDGIVEVGGDCDDTNADVNPDGTESCNGLDDDCDGTVDNGMLRAGVPRRLGLDGLFVIDTFFPYGEGYFALFYDSLSEQAQYVVLDAEGSITAGLLRPAPVVVRDFILFAQPIDDERIAVGSPAEVSEGVFAFQVGILNPANPTENLTPVSVLPTLEGLPTMVVAGDRIVVLENPASFQPADQPARMASVDFDLGGMSGPSEVARDGERFALTGVLGRRDAYLTRLPESESSSVARLDPATLELDPEVPVPGPFQLLTSPPPAAISVDGSGATFEITWIANVDERGRTTLDGTLVSDVRVAEELSGIGLTRQGEQFTLMSCFDDDTLPDFGQCGYQYARAGEDDPSSEVFPVEHPDDESGRGFFVTHLATREDGRMAAILIGGELSAGDPSAGMPQLYFVPFECPAP